MKDKVKYLNQSFLKGCSPSPSFSNEAKSSNVLADIFLSRFELTNKAFKFFKFWNISLEMTLTLLLSDKVW